MVNLEHHILNDVLLMCLKTSPYPKQTVSADQFKILQKCPGHPSLP